MMTREEAKKVFLNRGYIEVECGTIFDGDKWREACAMISKWLEQELCEDCISREAAKAAVRKHFGQSIPWTDQSIIEDLDALLPVTPKIAYPSYCGEDCTCDCPYLNQDEECIIELLNR